MRKDSDSKDSGTPVGGLDLGLASIISSEPKRNAAPRKEKEYELSMSEPNGSQLYSSSEPKGSQEPSSSEPGGSLGKAAGSAGISNKKSQDAEVDLGLNRIVSEAEGVNAPGGIQRKAFFQASTRTGDRRNAENGEDRRTALFASIVPHSLAQGKGSESYGSPADELANGGRYGSAYAESFESLCTRLSRDESWAMLAQACEQRLSEASGSRDQAARVWWTRAQLRMSQIPFSILADTVGSIYTEIFLVRDRRIAADVVAPMEELLSEAITIFEKQQHFEAAAQFKSMKQGLSKLPVAESPVAVAEPSRSRAPSQQNAAELPPLPSRKGRSARWQRLAFVFCLLSCLAIYNLGVPALQDLRLPDLTGEPLGASAFVTNRVPGPSTVPAATERLTRISSLSGLMYELAGALDIGKKTEPAANQQDPAPGDEASASNSPEAQAAAEPGPQEAAPAKADKEIINTDGPKESELKTEASKEPEIDPATADGGVTVPGFEFPPYVHGKAPERIASQDVRPAPRYYGRGRVYRVRHHTPVWDGPSFSSYQIDELHMGDRIMVVGNNLGWLILESKKGRGGYIPFEYADPLP